MKELTLEKILKEIKIQNKLLKIKNRMLEKALCMCPIDGVFVSCPIHGVGGIDQKYF